MKLSIEEKAKAYDKAIKVARFKMRNDKDHVLYEEDITDIFPELKESEDEKIRKSLIELFKDMEWDDSILHDYNMDKDKTIAWLEKQGEKKSVERKDFISIPFGTDSELVNETITIPDGCYATIEGNKIHIKREDL